MVFGNKGIGPALVCAASTGGGEKGVALVGETFRGGKRGMGEEKGGAVCCDGLPKGGCVLMTGFGIGPNREMRPFDCGLITGGFGNTPGSDFLLPVARPEVGGREEARLPLV